MTQSHLKSCHCCGLIHQVPTLGSNQRAHCTRCHRVIDRPRGFAYSQGMTAACVVAAMALFPAAILLPILDIERLGHHHRSSLVDGILDLFHHGNYVIGLVILVFSIVLPLAKLILLLELSWLCTLNRHQRAWTYRWMEQIGKWSMMDVLLLAFLVMLIKLSGILQFHFGPAVVAFAMCVCFSILASISFDPHAIWDSHE